MYQQKLKNFKKNTSPQPSTSGRSPSDSEKEFEFDKLYIFCRQDALDNFIKSKRKKFGKRYNEIHIISDISLNTTLCNYASEYKENNRLHSILIKADFDLTKVKARYHNVCQKKFLKSMNKLENDKADQISKRILDFIVNYVKNNKDKDIFSLSEILELYSSENSNGELPTIQWIKRLLLGHLDDDIFIATNKKGENML